MDSESKGVENGAENCTAHGGGGVRSTTVVELCEVDLLSDELERFISGVGRPTNHGVHLISAVVVQNNVTHRISCVSGSLYVADNFNACNGC